MQMDTNKILGALKRVASLLLIFCLFMPLSRCSVTLKENGKPVTHVTIERGYEKLNVNADTLAKAGPKDILLALATASVFFLPLLSFLLPATGQVWLQVIWAPLAEFWLYLLTYAYSGIEIGGALAMAAWAVLFVLGCVSLWQRWRGRRRSTPQLAGASP